MWVFTEDGFYSAVMYRDNPDYVIVRCRALKDAERLAYWHTARNYPVEVEVTPTADYGWRVTMLRRNWSNYVAESAANIGYTNFKAAIAKLNPDRAEVYADVWATLLDIQRPVFEVKTYKVPKE